MRRPLLIPIVGLLFGAAILSLSPDLASALPGSDNSTTVPPPPPTIAAETGLPSVRTPGDDGGSGGGSEPVPVPCTWIDVPTTQSRVDDVNGIFVTVANVLEPIIGSLDLTALTYYERFGVLHRAGDAPGEWLKSQEADCSRATAPGGVNTGDRRWVVSVPPDPATLLPGTRRRVSEIVAPPAPAINPAGPGYAQLGMWLAVEDAGPYIARAQLPATGPATVWAETRAMLSQTTFRFDSGGSVTCAGAGTPIPATARDDVGEGPCGYTFRDFVGDTTIVITSEWTVSWELSDGRSGLDPNPIVLSTTMPYEVREIQTVGVGADRP